MTMANPFAWFVLAPLLGLSGATLFHLALAKLIARSGFGSVFRSIAAGAVATVLISLAALEGKVNFANLLVYLTFNLLTFALLGFGYFALAALSISSLRIRILQEFLGCEQGLTRQEIVKRYDERRMVDNRIHRLTSGGQIIERNGRFFGGRAFVLRLARATNVLRFLILGKQCRTPTLVGPR
jgi:hypothetical protein